MTPIEIKTTETGHVLVTVKLGEIVQAQAHLSLLQAIAVGDELTAAIWKLMREGNEKTK